MCHLSIYVDRETESIIRKAAKKSSVSMSKWICSQLLKSIQTEWSDSFKKLAGSIPDMPSLHEIRAFSSSDSKSQS
jgi:hypothetical protein